MVYKLFLEEGEYRDIATLEPRNMLKGNIAWTPEGENVGWDTFDTDEQAMQFYGIELLPENNKIILIVK
jgi:hypothetical protein